MSTQIPNVNNIKSGLCPHGLPPGACPICSNMGGGGSFRANERAQKPGEMSYHQCVVMGNLMRARELAQKRHLQNLENHTDYIKNFETTMARAVENIKNFILKTSSFPITKPVAFVTQHFFLPAVNIIQNLPKIFQNMQNLKIDIQDKLNSIFGEAKNFVQKKVADIVSTIKLKLEGLFKILKKHNANDDDTKIDDDKKIFNLKTILHKIIRKKKDDNSSKDK